LSQTYDGCDRLIVFDRFCWPCQVKRSKRYERASDFTPGFPNICGSRNLVERRSLHRHALVPQIDDHVSGGVIREKRRCQRKLLTTTARRRNITPTQRSTTKRLPSITTPAATRKRLITLTPLTAIHLRRESTESTQAALTARSTETRLDRFGNYQKSRAPASIAKLGRPHPPHHSCNEAPYASGDCAKVYVSRSRREPGANALNAHLEI
jgi:hypothetical protein